MSKSRILIAALAIGLASVSFAESPDARAALLDRDGEQIGEAHFFQGQAGTLIRIVLEGLPPGPKAVHIHSVGTCDDHCDGFQDSGGHLNPDGRKHGLLNPDGPDAGDLPNFMVQADGTAWVEFHTSLASLDGSIGGQILDEDGAAIVIHENPDDHLSQPIGGAGARIACGVIRPSD
jgi:superoxide dismutase, Cu-Zn family